MKLKPFDLIVTAGVLLEVYNLYLLGQGHIHYPIMIMVFTLFAISEAWVAIADNRKSYWLFVALSIFGVIQGVTGYVRQ